MSITINELESGIGLKIDGNIWVVLHYQHVKPGKGSAFARVRMKNVKTHQVLERTFRSSESLEDIELEEVRLQMMYKSADGVHFMNHESYEEIVIAEATISDEMKFLQENMEVNAICYNHEVLQVILPTFIIAEVTHADPGLKGDSSRAGNKPVTIDTGATVQVPLFINTGEFVKIDTRSGEYVERVKK